MRQSNLRQSMPLLIWPFAAAALTAAWLLYVPAANAQVQSPPPGSPDQTLSISDQKLDAAAAAMKEVASVKEDYEQRIEAAAPSDKQRIANEANNALVQAVTDKGLSVEEYTLILAMAQRDPEVREKIVQRIRPSAK
jgi:Domain of unknown function (DUF4168)